MFAVIILQLLRVFILTAFVSDSPDRIVAVSDSDVLIEISLIILAIITGGLVGYVSGPVVRELLEAFNRSWYGPARILIKPILGYSIGYVIIVTLFASIFSFVNATSLGTAFCVRADLPDVTAVSDGTAPRVCAQPSSVTYGDFMFLSATTFTTVGYGWNTLVPTAKLAQAAVALEPIAGFLWTAVVFGLILQHKGVHTAKEGNSALR